MLQSQPVPNTKTQPQAQLSTMNNSLQVTQAPNAGLDALSTAAVMSAPAITTNRASLPQASAPPLTDAVQLAVDAFMSIIQQSQITAASQSLNSAKNAPRANSQSAGHSQAATQVVEQPNAMVINALERMIDTLKENATTKPKPVPEQAATPPADVGQNCHICGKFLKRNCDMNKHLKRHTKPYGCTFANCDKVFGSKNDWKRHENSQHFQGEFFKCQQSYPGEKFDKCSYMTQHESAMEKHLTEVHALSKDAAKGSMTVSHVGRNHQSRFWCGFCGDVVRLDNQGVQAWDERFNHIDKHFMKERRRVEEWVDPETYKTKGQLQEDEAERRRKRHEAAVHDDTAAQDGTIISRKRAGSVLSHESGSTKQPRTAAQGANIFITCVSFPDHGFSPIASLTVPTVQMRGKHASQQIASTVHLLSREVVRRLW